MSAWVVGLALRGTSSDWNGLPYKHIRLAAVGASSSAVVEGRGKVGRHGMRDETGLVFCHPILKTLEGVGRNCHEVDVRRLGYVGLKREYGCGGTYESAYQVIVIRRYSGFFSSRHICLS